MLTTLLATLVIALGTPGQSTNPACAVLTAQDVTALIGAAARPMSVTASERGGSCMFQNGDKVVTVLLTTQGSADDAAALWESKKRIVQGEDVPGWAAKAYAGAMVDSAAVGLAKGTTFIEVKIIDKTQKLPDLGQKLRTVMKGVAGRL